MCDIRACEHLIPKKFKDSHDYETGVVKYELNMPDGRVPLDLAFCRWMAVEKGVVMMPNSFFYKVGSSNTCDHFVRLALCKEKSSIGKCLLRLKERS